MTTEALRFWYATGYKTREQAKEKLEDYYAEGIISEGEKPKVTSYKTKMGLFWGIRLNG